MDTINTTQGTTFLKEDSPIFEDICTLINNVQTDFTHLSDTLAQNTSAQASAITAASHLGSAISDTVTNPPIMRAFAQDCAGILHCIDKFFQPLAWTTYPFIKLFCGLLFIAFLWFFVSSLYNFISFFVQKIVQKGLRNEAKLNSFFSRLVIATLLFGTLLYTIGLDCKGTGESFFSLLFMALLSSFQMFLAQNNYAWIAPNCQNNGVYMLLHNATHLCAMILTSVFAVLFMYKLLKHRLKAWFWSWRRVDEICVFWGFNDRSYALARDIYNTRKSRKIRTRIVFVDYPEDELQTSQEGGFSGLLGVFNDKKQELDNLKGINYFFFRCSCRPSKCDARGADFFDAMDLRRLRRLVNKAKAKRFFILTDNEPANLQAAVNILDLCGEKYNLDVYCSARKTRYTRLLDEKYDQGKGRLHLLDDSRLAVTSLKKREVPESNPIDYVDIDTETASVFSVFTALMVGFGTTGQEALRFLYEFSAWPDKGGDKQPVRLHVVDNHMEDLRGEFRHEVPAIDYMTGEKSSELFDKIVKPEVKLHQFEVGSSAFLDLLDKLKDSLNYVVVAAGDDDQNLSIASFIIDYMLQHRQTNRSKFRVFVRLYNHNNKSKFDTAKEMYRELCIDYKANSKPAIGDNEDYFSSPFEYFGGPEQLYNAKIIIDKKLEEEAKKYYDAYRNATNGAKTWEVRHANAKTAYAHLDLYRKENQDRANSMHSYTKERLLNLGQTNTVILCDSNQVLNLSDKDQSKSAQWKRCLLQVSKCEHLRWNASHLMLGYVPMRLEDFDGDFSAYEVRKEQVCLRPWNELPDIQTNYKNQFWYYDYMVVWTTIIRWAQS